jgi:hypothetical protein
MSTEQALKHAEPETMFSFEELSDDELRRSQAFARAIDLVDDARECVIAARPLDESFDSLDGQFEKLGNRLINLFYRK